MTRTTKPETTRWWDFDKHAELYDLFLDMKTWFPELHVDHFTEYVNEYEGQGIFMTRDNLISYMKARAFDISEWDYVD